MNTALRNELLSAFALDEYFTEISSFGNGHINETYAVTLELPSGTKRYILQKMNHSVFKKPWELMENITGVTSWLRRKIMENGGDPDRETLNVLPANNGRNYYQDSEGGYWRVFSLIDHIVCYDQVSCSHDFYRSGQAFGHFQNMLSDYPAHTLHETIVNFHNTPVRYRSFLASVEADSMGRAASVLPEIEFVKARSEYVHTLTDKEKSGLLPLRVTHNDTKLNNVLFDQNTGEAICVIDLDTVMPGLSVNDFGDAIRFGASTAPEDEQDLSRVSCDLTLFEAFAKGFLEECAGSLTEEEINCLVDGAIMMTLECGMRFLADHLDGDVYFRIHRDNHNLDRARTQFRLVADMEQKRPQMESIIRQLTETVKNGCS